MRQFSIVAPLCLVCLLPGVAPGAISFQIAVPSGVHAAERLTNELALDGGFTDISDPSGYRARDDSAHGGVARDMENDGDRDCFGRLLRGGRDGPRGPVVEGHPRQRATFAPGIGPA